MYHTSPHPSPFYLYLITLMLASVLLLSSGCTEVSTFEKQQAWLEKNYPSRKKNLQKLNAPSMYENEILDGQAVIGMRWQEVLIAKLITPYGPKAGRAFYWQGNQLVPTCINQCKALLVTKFSLYFFESRSDGLRLASVATKTNWPKYAGYTPESYEQARSLYAQGQ